MTDLITEAHEINAKFEEQFKEPKRAFLVIGPEGSGGYMLTEALVAAGCYWEQDFQNEGIIIKWDEKPWPLVIHRSLPHNGEWPKIWGYLSGGLINGLIKSDWQYHILFILRDFNATYQSVRRRSKIRTDETLRVNQLMAFKFMGDIAMEIFPMDGSEYTYITYEAFTTSEGFRRWLFEDRLQLPYPADYNVENRNLQYYEEEN